MGMSKYSILPRLDVRFQIDIHNHIFDRTDNRPAKAAYIEESETISQVYGYKTYKLKWRGDAKA